MNGALYKILSAAEWRAAQGSGVVAWSAADLGDGFMHLSTYGQALETARRHFSGRKDLVALEIDASRVAGALRLEPSCGGDLFPHLYGELSVDAVLRVRPLAEDAAGGFRFVDGGGKP